jgi:hypothetical protein
VLGYVITFGVIKGGPNHAQTNYTQAIKTDLQATNAQPSYSPSLPHNWTSRHPAPFQLTHVY